MDAQQFAYWLQGFAELNAAPPTAEQWQSIREHLGTVFFKVTPPLGINDFAKHLEKAKQVPATPGSLCPLPSKPYDIIC